MMSILENLEACYGSRGFFRCSKSLIWNSSRVFHDTKRTSKEALFDHFIYKGNSIQDKANVLLLQFLHPESGTVSVPHKHFPPVLARLHQRSRLLYTY